MSSRRPGCWCAPSTANMQWNCPRWTCISRSAKPSSRPCASARPRWRRWAWIRTWRSASPRRCGAWMPNASPWNRPPATWTRASRSSSAIRLRPRRRRSPRRSGPRNGWMRAREGNPGTRARRRPPEHGGPGSAVVLARGLERGQLFRRGLALVAGLPLGEGHAVDGLAGLFLVHFEPGLERGLAVPVGQAVAAEAGQDHQVDVLDVGARLVEVPQQPAERGRLQFHRVDHAPTSCVRNRGQCAAPSPRPASIPMTARILDGRRVSEDLLDELKTRVDARVARGLPRPGLAVVLVGDDPASSVYVRNKRRAAEKVGIEAFDYDMPAGTSEAELLALVDRLNADPKIHGILVQLPLPGIPDASRLIERIDPRKDVDGFHPSNVGHLALRQFGLRPCTPRGI